MPWNLQRRSRFDVVGVLKTLLFFGPLLGFLIWQYLSVSRDLERNNDGDSDTDAGH